MTLQVSTGFKQLILGPSSFESIFNFGCIRIFDGAQPTTADGAEGPLLIGVVSLNGLPWDLTHLENGLSFSRSGPYVSKQAWQPWQLNVSVGGFTARWFRLIGPGGDDGSASFAFPRIDGAIAATGGEMVLANLTPTAGTLVSIDAFLYTILPIVGV